MRWEEDLPYLNTLAVLVFCSARAFIKIQIIMQNTLSINGTALPGFAEPTKKQYHLEHDEPGNFLGVLKWASRNKASVKKWQEADMLLPKYFPVNFTLDSLTITENVLALHERMYDVRILDIIQNMGKPHIEIKLPQYISVRPGWIIALNTFIQAVDGGIVDVIQDITDVLNNERLWRRMDYEGARTRERLFMLRYFLWQILKTK